MKRKQQAIKRSLILLAALILGGLTLGTVFLSALDLWRSTKTSYPITTITDVVVHSTLSDQARVGPQWMEPRGIGLGYVWPENRNTPPQFRPQNDEVHLSPGQPFALLLILNSEKPATMLITAVLNYQQVEFKLDGQSGLLHEVTVNPGGDLELPIEVNVTGEGFHDLMVIAFTDIYNNSTNPMFRLSASNSMVGRRVQIVVGDGEPLPARELPAPLQGRNIPSEVTLGFGAAFATYTNVPAQFTHPSDMDRQMYVAQARPGEVFKYQIWSSNWQGEEASDYALMLFHNYHQVTINGNPLVVAHLDPNEEVIWDVETNLSASRTVDQMQIAYVFDPYKSLLRGEARASFVFESFRLVVELSK